MDDAHYLALKARDARFDGQFFTGVTSTGIYCRPVCKVRTPKQENCRLFQLAAQAESAGFRPCLRCRPELAPGHVAGSEPAWSTQDASAILARQAAGLLDAPDLWSDGAVTLVQLAGRLGVSERHVRRLFETHWGVSPLQYLQTRRLLTAKQLLTDTRLPVAQVAVLSGFSSVRRFNAAFVEHYRLQPRALRAAGKLHPAGAPAGIRLTASYRPPYEVAAMLGFFEKRSIGAVESVDLNALSLVRTVRIASMGRVHTGWVKTTFVPAQCQVVFLVGDSLASVLPALLQHLKAMFDLDADPHAIDTVLNDRFPGTAGMRVPGTLDGFELAIRAILGQQITVQAARTLTTRLVERFGEDIETPFAPVHRLFPSARALAVAAPEDLGALGIVRQRQQAMLALARAVDSGNLILAPGVDISTTLAALQALPGIGPWTAHYIGMRALRWPDAFPSGDVALHKALGVQGMSKPAQAAEAASCAWQPWRSYAVIRAWSTL